MNDPREEVKVKVLDESEDWNDSREPNNSPNPNREPDPGNNGNRPPGGLMIIIGWGLAILVLTMFFSGVLDQRQNPNQLAVMQDGRLSLEPNQNGHYVVDGRINGYRVTFLVDTGATSVAVPEAIAEQAGLKTGQPLEVSTAAGNVRAHNSRIHRLEVGDFIFSDLRAVIIPSDSRQVLLGMNVLGQLEMSNEDGALVLKAGS